jgi:hypothetical protein
MGGASPHRAIPLSSNGRFIAIVAEGLAPAFLLPDPERPGDPLFDRKAKTVRVAEAKTLKEDETPK